jgi:hypothetical protein
MFGKTNRRIDVIELEISKLKLVIDQLVQNMRSTRGLVNRKLRNTLEGEEEGEEENTQDRESLQSMQLRMLGFPSKD